MNFGKLREVFVHNMPKKKNLLHFLHRCHGFREMSKLQSPDPRRLAKAQKRRKRPNPLHILAEASLKDQGTQKPSHSSNPKKIWEFWVILAIFGNLQVLAPQRVSPPVRPFVMAAPFCKNSTFLDFSCKVTYAYGWTWVFMEFWASRRSKYMQNLTFCPFFELQKQSWENWLLTGNMTSKSKNSSWVGK